MTRKEAKQFIKALKDALKGKPVLKRDYKGKWEVYNDLLCREAVMPSDFKRLGKDKKKSKTILIEEAEAFLGVTVKNSTTGKLYKVFNVYYEHNKLCVSLSTLDSNKEVEPVVSIKSFLQGFTVVGSGQ